MLEGAVPPATLRDTLLAALPIETDELNLQQMLDYSTRARSGAYTLPEDRPASRPRARAVLRAGLAGRDDERARPGSTRSALGRDDRRHARVARAGLARAEQGPRAAARGDRRGRPGLRAGGAGPADCARRFSTRSSTGCRTPIGRRGSRSSCRRFVAIRVIREGFFESLRERRESRARGLGARRDALPAPSAARRDVGAIRPASARARPGDSAHRRHLLPEALGRRDARRLSVDRRRPPKSARSSTRCRPTIHRGCAGSCSSAADPLFARRSCSSRRASIRSADRRSDRRLWLRRATVCRHRVEHAELPHHEER